MTAAEVVIVDVGHGNCTILRSGDWTAVVDMAPAMSALDELRRLGVTQVDDLVLSHVDADHIAGALRLLNDPDISVGALWVNPDPTKDTKVFDDLRETAADVRRRRGLEVSTSLNDATPPWIQGSLRMDVIHPDLDWAMAGTGAGTTGTTNTMSAVLRICLEGSPATLLAADLTAAGFARMMAIGHDVTARVLVFPHHGGGAGTSGLQGFATALASAVTPELVVFSHGRDRFRNPRPDVVAGTLAAVPHARVACSQLSRHCAPDDVARDMNHLSSNEAAGRSTGASCAGTLSIRRVNDEFEYSPAELGHQQFIDVYAPTPLCRVQRPN